MNPTKRAKPRSVPNLEQFDFLEGEWNSICRWLCCVLLCRPSAWCVHDKILTPDYLFGFVLFCFCCCAREGYPASMIRGLGTLSSGCINFQFWKGRM
jgi:hypothetical protein